MTQPEKVDLLLKGGTLVTMDSQRRMIENGALAVRDNKIFMVGSAKEVLPKVEAQKTLDVSGQVVTPGFINAHGHWAMTLFRGMVDDRPLEAWLSRVWKMELAFTSPKNVVAGAQLAMAEMIRSGTTCAADMYWQFRHSTEAALQANFRLVNGPTFAEIKGFGSRPLSTPKNAHEFINRYKDEPLVVLCVQVHAAYTASLHLMEEARRIAEESGAVFITHASESRAEVENVRKMYGKTPIEVLQSVGLLGGHTLLAHCVHLNDEEIQLLAETKNLRRPLPLLQPQAVLRHCAGGGDAQSRRQRRFGDGWTRQQQRFGHAPRGAARRPGAKRRQRRPHRPARRRSLRHDDHQRRQSYRSGGAARFAGSGQAGGHHRAGLQRGAPDPLLRHLLAPDLRRPRFGCAARDHQRQTGHGRPQSAHAG
jgi:hypothetical protein